MCGLFVISMLVLISAYAFLAGIFAAVLADHWRDDD